MGLEARLKVVTKSQEPQSTVCMDRAASKSRGRGVPRRPGDGGAPDLWLWGLVLG